MMTLLGNKGGEVSAATAASSCAFPQHTSDAVRQVEGRERVNSILSEKWEGESDTPRRNQKGERKRYKHKREEEGTGEKETWGVERNAPPPKGIQIHQPAPTLTAFQWSRETTHTALRGKDFLYFGPGDRDGERKRERTPRGKENRCFL